MTEDTKHEELMGALTTIATNTARVGDLLQRLLDQRAAKATAPAGRPASVPDKGGGTFVLRFGKSKGLAVGEAPVDDLEWTGRVLAENVADPAKAKYRDSNEGALDAVRAELARRKGTKPAADWRGPPPNEEEPPLF